MVCGGVSGIESRTPHGLLPSTCSGSSWLVPHTWVANGAPGTTSTRPPVVVVFVEPVGGVVPVLRDRVEGARRGEPAGPGQRRGGGQRHQHHDPDGHPLVVFGVGERVDPHPSRRAARQRDAAQQMRQAERQRQPDHRLELVHVAQRGAARVEECLHLVGDRRSQPAGVADGQQHDADQQHDDQPAAGGHRAHRQPGQPAAATNVVASTATDPVTNEAPAVALGATNGVQL